MVASQPIRIGFIGRGNIAHSHMQAIQRIPEIEIAAGADTKIDRAQKFVQEAGAEATNVFAMGRQIHPSWDDVDEVTIQMALSNGLWPSRLTV